MANLKEESKKDWQSASTTEHINAGSLQRIADATEKMAGNFIRLQNDLNMYKRWYEEGKKTEERMARRIIALKGVITKLKNKLNS